MARPPDVTAILDALDGHALLDAQRAYEALLARGPSADEVEALRRALAWEDDLAEEQLPLVEGRWLRHDHLAAHAFARRLWGVTLPERGPEAALARVEEALARHDQPVLRYQKARLLQDFGRDADAAPLLEALEGWLHLLDRDAERDYWNRRCYLSQDGADHGLALALARRFLERFPDEALAHTHVALAMAPGLPDALLISRLLAVAERFPDDPAPLGTLADQLRLRGQPDQAIAYATRGLRRDAGHRVSLSVLTRVHLGRGDGEAALPYARALLRLNPSSEEALRWLAVALQLSRRTDDALDVNRALLERYGEQPQDVLRQVGMLLSKGASEESRDWAEKLVKLSPASSLAWVMAGLVRWQHDELEGAAEALRRALAAEPVDRRVEMLRERLASDGVRI